MSLHINSTVQLRNGVEIPLLGFGTYQMFENGVMDSVPAALECGYRLIDTAAIYKNEGFVGNAIRKFLEKNPNVTRKDIFIESKLQPADQGYEKAKLAIDKCLNKIGIEYIDLLIIHWPGTAGIQPSDSANKIHRRGTWKALEEALEEGKVRSIGVSNYLICHLEEMKEYATIFPMVNQFEIHPAFYQDDLIEYCRKNGIFVQAYSSLARGKLMEPSFLENQPQILALVNKYQATLSQIYLRWALQHQIGILPKTNSPERVVENSKLYFFELNSEEMSYLDSIHQTISFKTCWNPVIIN